MDKYVKNLDFCLDFVQYDEYEDNGKLCMWGRGGGSYINGTFCVISVNY